jgi:hypothetical protein
MGINELMCSNIKNTGNLSLIAFPGGMKGTAE